MAEWWAKENKRDCDLCRRLKDPKAFAPGTKIHIAEATDCSKCEVAKHQPNRANEIIIDLYNNLPPNFGVSGHRNISAGDVCFIFDLYDIPKRLWQDYYSRILFFCREMRKAYEKQKPKEADTKKKEKTTWRPGLNSPIATRRIRRGKSLIK